MTADETLRFLEAYCWSMLRQDSFPAAHRYGVEIFDPEQRRRRMITGPTIRAAVMKAQEVNNGNQENNETETAN